MPTAAVPTAAMATVPATAATVPTAAVATMPAAAPAVPTAAAVAASTVTAAMTASVLRERGGRHRQGRRQRDNQR